MQWSQVSRLLLVVGLPAVLVLIAMVRVQSKIPTWISRPVNKSRYKALLPYVYAQVMHETGGLTSDIFKKANNPLGFKTYGGRPSQHPSTRDGGYYNFFATPEEGIYHLLVWFDRKDFPRSVKNAREYAEQLKARAYYQAPVDVYHKNLEHWLKTLQ
jgi:hypothetical protein